MAYLSTSRSESIHGAEQLLVDYLSGELPLIGLARRHDLTLDQLLAWLDKPGTRRILAAIESASRRRAEVIAAMSLPTALQSLETVAASAENDETRRKAAAGILRAHRAFNTPPQPPKNQPPDIKPPRRRPPRISPTLVPDARSPMPLRIPTPALPIFTNALHTAAAHAQPAATRAFARRIHRLDSLNTGTLHSNTNHTQRGPPGATPSAVGRAETEVSHQYQNDPAARQNAHIQCVVRPESPRTHSHPAQPTPDSEDLAGRGAQPHPHPHPHNSRLPLPVPGLYENRGFLPSGFHPGSVF